MQQDPIDNPPSKRRKLNVGMPREEVASTKDQTTPRKGLNRPISPPLSRRKSPEPALSFAPSWSFDDVPNQTLASRPAQTTTANDETEKEKGKIERVQFTSSPIQLTKIEKLPQDQNVDAVGLADLLGDPLIKECWNFNFLFDLGFVMQHFDSDVRDIIKVKIIHGFWKRDDDNRIALLEAAERYPNIELLSAYIPDPFGTHHSKMLILFRHDDTAQVVIHTANMIHRDWANMTQAVWASPRLPLLSRAPQAEPESLAVHSIGSGKRFKSDLLRYLGAYKNRLKGLTTQLKYYDFSSIRAAFIGSAPSRQKPAMASPSVTSFGWLGLREILSSIPISSKKNSRPHIVTQISSIATLGAAPTWLSHFQSVLSRYSTTEEAVAGAASTSFTKASTLFTKHSPDETRASDPKFSVIFPTPNEIRMSLDGYMSGGSIHWKLQSTQQQKQLDYMHPLLCHWDFASTPPPPPPPPSPSSTNISRKEAHRGLAAPHIKTYIRFSNSTHDTIDWAILTSANLSKQAWGDVLNKKDEIWIQSWETGVVVWPALYAQSAAAEERVAMVPVFGRDGPGREHVPASLKADDAEEGVERKTVLVGFRMPYDLPLVPYAADERPWCATVPYGEPDRYGRAWVGYGG